MKTTEENTLWGDSTSWVDEYKNARAERVGGKPCKFNKTVEREEYNKTMGIKLCDSFEFRRDVINRTAKQQRIKKSY